uniref:Rhoptry neck protein 5 n=1 Tax=Strongyloides papillosus TaxID=174720 RepID=A0A0N5C0E7_STREA
MFKAYLQTGATKMEFFDYKNVNNFTAGKYGCINGYDDDSKKIAVPVLGGKGITPLCDWRNPISNEEAEQTDYSNYNMDKAINDVTNVIMKCKNEFEAKKTVMKSYKGFNFPNKDKLKTVKRFLSFLYSEIEKRKPMFDLKAMEKSLNPHSLRQYGREQILEEKLNLTKNEKNCCDLVNEFANNHHLNTNQSLQAFKKFLYELSQCINNKHVGDAAYNLEKITLNNIIKTNIIHEDIEICSNEKISSFYYINPDFIINNLLEKTGYYPTGTYIKLILYLNGMSLAQLNSSRCKNRKIMHGVIKLSDFQNSSISYMPSFCTVNETELIQKNGFIAFARHVYSLLNNKHIILKNNDVVGNYLTQIEIISGDNELLNRILSVRGSNRNNNSKSCRLCNINGLDFSKITTCESAEKVEKRFNTDIFFKCQQYYFDIFHDISEGVLPLMSYQIVYWLLKNKIIPKQDLYKLLIRREIRIRKMSDLKYVLHKNSFARLIPDYNKKPKFLLSRREHLIFGRVLLSLLEDVENKNDKVFKECLNELDFSNISLEDSIVEDDVSELDSSLLLTSFEENKEEELDEMPDISVVPKIDQHTK